MVVGFWMWCFKFLSFNSVVALCFLFRFCWFAWIVFFGLGICLLVCFLGCLFEFRVTLIWCSVVYVELVIVDLFFWDRLFGFTVLVCCLFGCFGLCEFCWFGLIYWFCVFGWFLMFMTAYLIGVFDVGVLLVWILIFV